MEKGREKTNWVLFWRNSYIKEILCDTVQMFLWCLTWFLRIWLAEVPNSTTVLTLSEFWTYQLFFHYCMLWQAFQTDTRKEVFLTWISLSLNSLFWISRLLSPLYVKGSLGCTRSVRNVSLERPSLNCEGEMKYSVDSRNGNTFHPFRLVKQRSCVGVGLWGTWQKILL